MKKQEASITETHYTSLYMLGGSQLEDQWVLSAGGGEEPSDWVRV